MYRKLNRERMVTRLEKLAKILELNIKTMPMVTFSQIFLFIMYYYIIYFHLYRRHFWARSSSHDLY